MWALRKPKAVPDMAMHHVYTWMVTINLYRYMEDKSAQSMGMEGYEEQGEIAPQKRAAMIPDFCLRIPYGGLIFGGGLFGFVFSRNLLALKTNAIIGGALLAPSTMSLKVWRSGKSSFPFILGQIALSTTLLWKHFHTYMLTKKGFPALFYILISASMLGFYSYVILAGGNPPPKKPKSAKYSTA
ncbi:hypothetical protein MLD38_031017 [Melastoma candidum]|uniref:Uncharacterized protein n=1 Tax=Melastoma candidum TaxID=119954 RepID=A0ACB9MNZ6_9MYRT|nr:hypothetical protein MLD38_031017 [Melastoma candidum]